MPKASSSQLSEYDYAVLNDDLERAVARLTAIVDAERLRVARIAPPDLIHPRHRTGDTA